MNTDLSYCFILLSEALLFGEPFVWKKLENRPSNDDILHSVNHALFLFIFFDRL